MNRQKLVDLEVQHKSIIIYTKITNYYKMISKSFDTSVSVTEHYRLNLPCGSCGYPRSNSKYTYRIWIRETNTCSDICRRYQQSKVWTIFGISLSLTGIALILFAILYLSPALIVFGIMIVIGGLTLLIKSGVFQELSIIIWDPETMDDTSLSPNDPSNIETTLSRMLALKNSKTKKKINPKFESLDKPNFIEISHCCYQTARLGELYCRCGKVVSRELQNEIMRSH